VNEALLVGLGALTTAVVAGTVALLNAVHKHRMECKKNIGYERDLVVERLREQLERLDRQVAEQGAVIAFCHDAHAECEVQVSDLYGVALRYRDFAERCARALTKCGQDVGEAPPVPERPPRRDLRAEAEFAARTAQQDALLTQAVGRRAVPPAPRSGRMTRPVTPPEGEEP